METLYYLTAICLVGYMFLAMYDGIYLHLWKYELFNRKESLFEHKTHTVRAILFPLIVWLLLVKSDYYSFLIGIFLVILDVIVLAVDAYAEKDSRSFMGGLPKWEYIIHLFSNGFHFAIIALVIGLRIKLVGNNIAFMNHTTGSFGQELLHFISINALPGAWIIATIHFVLLIRGPRNFWLQTRSQINCC